MAGKILITGATGYIGTQLAWRARELGCEVVTLGSRSPLPSGENIPWRLGQTPPHESIKDAQALIHPVSMPQPWPIRNPNSDIQAPS